MNDRSTAATLDDHDHDQIADGREPGFALTWFAVLGGPAIWMVHLVMSAALVRASCLHDLSWLLNLGTAVAAAIAAATVVASAALVRHHSTILGRRNGRTPLLGSLGAFFGVASVMLILLEGAPVLFISECQR